MAIGIGELAGRELQLEQLERHAKVGHGAEPWRASIDLGDVGRIESRPSLLSRFPSLAASPCASTSASPRDGGPLLSAHMPSPLLISPRVEQSNLLPRGQTPFASPRADAHARTPLLASPSPPTATRLISNGGSRAHVRNNSGLISPLHVDIDGCHVSTPPFIGGHVRSGSAAPDVPGSARALSSSPGSCVGSSLIVAPPISRSQSEGHLDSAAAHCHAAQRSHASHYEVDLFRSVRVITPPSHRDQPPPRSSHAARRRRGRAGVRVFDCWTLPLARALGTCALRRERGAVRARLPAPPVRPGRQLAREAEGVRLRRCHSCSSILLPIFHRRTCACLYLLFTRRERLVLLPRARWRRRRVAAGRRGGVAFHRQADHTSREAGATPTPIPTRTVVPNLNHACNDTQALMAFLPAYERYVSIRRGRSLVQYFGCASMPLRWRFASKVRPPCVCNMMSRHAWRAWR